MYVKQECNILFYRKLRKINREGLVPLYARITIDGIRDEIATGIWLKPEHWNQEAQIFLPGAPQTQKLNDKIAKMRTDLTRHFDLAQVRHETAIPELVLKAYGTPLRSQKLQDERVENLSLSESLDSLVDRYVLLGKQKEKANDHALPIAQAKLKLLGKDHEALKEELHKILRRFNLIADDPDWEKTVMLAADQHIFHFMELCFAGHRSYTTLEKMWGRKKRLGEFLRYRYEAIDIPLSKVQLKIADQFLMYNISQHKIIENSAMKYIQFLKGVLARSFSNGWSTANVLDSYTCHYEDTDRKWPTPAELERFLLTDFDSELQNIVRDCYIFGCYTAFAYAELHSFSPDQIIVGIDGKKWADKSRRKTKVEECLPLLPISLTIVEKYKNHSAVIRRGKCLPIPCNIVYNRELKKMAKKIDWRIKLDGHTSRYYFINEVAYGNGINDLKSLAKMVGIKSIKTLLKYLKGNKIAVSENMQMVEKKLFHPDGAIRSADQQGLGGAKIISMQPSK